MVKKAVSILIGAKSVDGATFFATQIANQLNETEDYEVLQTFTAIKRDDITNTIGKKEYDIIICTEEMSGGQQIGAGSIKIWQEANPEIKICMILKDDKRGAKKVRSLFEKGYYDGIFVSDFSGGVNELKKLIIKGRTREEAAKYYQVEDMLSDNEKAEETPVSEQQDIKIAATRMPLEKEHQNQEGGTGKEVSPPMEPFYHEEEQSSYTQNKGFDVGIEEFERIREPKQPPQFVEKTMKMKVDIQKGKEEIEMDEQRNYMQRQAEVAAAPATSNRRGSSDYKPSVSSFEGYVVDVISDTAIVLEVPSAHFLTVRDYITQDKVNLVTPRMM